MGFFYGLNQEAYDRQYSDKELLQRIFVYFRPHTRKVITEGAVGIKASRVKVRFEDGVEVSRENLGEIVIAEAVKRVVHYGTKIVDKYLDTPDGRLT